MNPPYAAVILAGGRARRLGGRAKPELVLGGVRLLDRVLAAVPDAAPRIVVGPPLPVPAGVLLTREEPAGGGPVAALAAGLDLVGDVGYVVVLAADLPFVTADVVARLLAESLGRDGALLVDDGGRDQLLLGAWRTAALRAAVAALPSVSGASLRSLLAGLSVARVRVEMAAGAAPPWWDCDNEDDLRTAKEWT